MTKPDYSSRKKELSVLHVVRGLTNSSGTTHIVVPLSEEQARQGAKVTILSVEKDNEPAVEPDASLVKCRCFPMSLPLRNPGISFSFAREVKRKVKYFDVVHIHAIWNFPTYYAMRSALVEGVPYIVAPQGSLEPWALDQNAWGKWVYGALAEGPLLQRASYLQAVSAKEVEQIRNYGLRPPAVIIPNGVNLASFGRKQRPLACRVGFSPDQKTILYLSRLNPKKGADILIAAFAQVMNAADAVLVIAGDDSGSGYRARLTQLVTDYGLGSRCIFLGELKGADKFEVLLGADIFVLPSHSEGLPVAALEAMAARLPLIVTPNCNLPEVSEWGAGYIVAPEVREIAERLVTLLRQPTLAREMGANGRRLIDSKFTWERIAGQSLDRYQEALGRAPA